MISAKGATSAMVVRLRALLSSLDDFSLTCVSTSRQIAERLKNKPTVKVDGSIYILSTTSSNVCRSMLRTFQFFPPFSFILKSMTQFKNVDIDIDNSRNLKLNVVFPVREKRAMIFFVVVEEEKDRIDKPADRDRGGDITKRWRNTHLDLMQL